MPAYTQNTTSDDLQAQLAAARAEAERVRETAQQAEMDKQRAEGDATLAQQ